MNLVCFPRETQEDISIDELTIVANKNIIIEAENSHINGYSDLTWKLSTTCNPSFILPEYIYFFWFK